MSCYTYILWSDKLQSFYIGASCDMDRRLRDHNSGNNRSTKSGIPWQLVWKTAKPSKPEAVSLEKKLKNLRSQDRIRAFTEKYAEDKV